MERLVAKEDYVRYRRDAPRKTSECHLASMGLSNYPSNESQIPPQMGRTHFPPFSEWTAIKFFFPLQGEFFSPFSHGVEAEEGGSREKSERGMRNEKEGGLGRFSPLKLGTCANSGGRSALQSAYLAGCF